MSPPAELPDDLQRRVLRAARPNVPTRVRLFWLPHAGGSSTSFPSWHRFFPPDWEVAFLEVPIAHDSFVEPTCLDEVVGLYLAAIRTRLDLPFGIFGHSLGALVGLELSRRLRERGDPMPCWLGISGRRPPGSTTALAGLPLSTMRDDELVERIESYGGTPPQILADREFRSLLLYRLRRDLRWSEEHVSPEATPLEIPISTFAGDEDPSAPPAEVSRWREWTTGSLRARTYPGGHFYLFAHREAVCEAIRTDLLASS